MDEDDSLAIDPEMAAFMGFASFGTQPAAKKRKYNHRTDAVSSATGANQTALAPRAPRPAPSTTTDIAAAPAANADEIALDDDDEDDGSAVVAAAGDVDAEEGGANLYSDPTVAPALAHAQSLIDELANQGAAVEDGISAPQAQSTASSLPTSSALPQRPDASWGKKMGTAPTTMPTRERPEQHQHQHQRGGRGGYQQQQRNDGKPWWEGYYDPASNENPWERLEKKAGVLSKGTWVARGTQPQTA
ncbi:hypothetical protein HER10_EVM0008104 [Colletotrichum scovillei]|uniref:Uncharacterized protein n=1 Tax=Colletotrichum scovillei TaxID=1209932 RepID=A0A9P7R992_9PEZI|nr:uncharacterized protein HER10_EVM0008104 [Colletotrichum scovillei]KAF4776692.1 hypothetical protein HER10_EVM0008104 [Colletotrichum scovillei]KAG7053252.1 hypothetical protein JMJ77_0000342 [Colletotrichum scovillei]KAG7071550.1 hypothetical protein JMJ76_0004421 [Colletotrichum scovillei]KAG7079830.1 hypothetical protein JMJ78_0006934 [Colletotrichum scovillei]